MKKGYNGMKKERQEIGRKEKSYVLSGCIQEEKVGRQHWGWNEAQRGWTALLTMLKKYPSPPRF